MRIAYLSTFYPFRGGIAQFNASLYRVLEQQHDVKAFTFTRQYPGILFPGETQYVTESDNADPIPSTPVLDTVNPISYLTTAAKIKQFDPDLLLMKYWTPFFGPSLGTVARRLGKKTKCVPILDNLIPHERKIIDAPFNSYFVKPMDGLVAMSQSVKDDLTNMSPTKKSTLIPHPHYDHFGESIPEVTAQQALGIPSGKKTLLFFGFIRDYKGLDLLIKAMSHLDQSYQLVVAGECYGDFAKYQELIEASPLKDQILLHNHYIGDDQVPSYFCAADACILPYTSATQSGIGSIATHFALPILATDVGGLKESIDHGSTGMIIPSPDPVEISNTIKAYFLAGGKQAFAPNIQLQKQGNSWETFAADLMTFVQSL